MELVPFAVDRHIEEALRLFQVSTLEAATSGSLSGAEGFTTQEDQEMLNRIEKQLKRRFAIGSQVRILCFNDLSQLNTKRIFFLGF